MAVYLVYVPLLTPGADIERVTINVEIFTRNLDIIVSLTYDLIEKACVRGKCGVGRFPDESKGV